MRRVPPPTSTSPVSVLVLLPLRLAPPAAPSPPAPAHVAPRAEGASSPRGRALLALALIASAPGCGAGARVEARAPVEAPAAAALRPADARAERVVLGDRAGARAEGAVPGGQSGARAEGAVLGDQAAPRAGCIGRGVASAAGGRAGVASSACATDAGSNAWVAEATSPPPADWRKTTGLVSVALGSTLVVMGVAASISIAKVVGEFRDDDGFLKYRAGIQRGGDVCDAIDRGAVSPQPGAAELVLLRDRCQNLSVWKTVQPIGFVGGGLLVAGGAALLISSALSPPRSDLARSGRTRLSFAPALSPSSAGAMLGGAW